MRDVGQKLVSPLARAPSFFHRRKTCPWLTAVRVIRRLKLLKDEIRKPYFIKLKQFLWDQGVKGASDSPASLKIYPARKRIHSVYIASALSSIHSQKHLLVVKLNASRPSQGSDHRSGPVSRTRSSSRSVQPRSHLTP